MKTHFNNIRISSIVTFDLLQKDLNFYPIEDSSLEELRENIINGDTKFFDKTPEYVRFQNIEKYYDPKYIEKAKILEVYVKLNNINQLTCIKDDYKWHRFLKRLVSALG